MNFKPGDRVKVIRCDPPPHHLRMLKFVDYTGHEGTVVPRDRGEPMDPELQIPVRLDGDDRRLWFRAYELAPLTDPHAEQFMEWVRALDKAPIRELQPDEMERVRSAG